MWLGAFVEGVDDHETWRCIKRKVHPRFATCDNHQFHNSPHRIHWAVLYYLNMTSAMSAPMPSYPGTVLPIHDHPAWKHLSGTTMETTTKEPIAYTRELSWIGNTTLNRFSEVTTSTKRSSYASTTKSRLRKSNQQLFDMLQNIQTELATHRAIMLDVQSRLSFIEQDAPTMVEDVALEVLSPMDEPKPPQRPPPPPPRRASSTILPGMETESWWQACQNFAGNCDTPFNAQEFLKTPSRFEDFDFHFGGLATDGVRTSTPPEIEDTPNHSPDLKRHSSRSARPRSPSIFSDEGSPRTSGLTMDSYEEPDSIIEQVVEFKKPTITPLLLLHPPPTGRCASLSSVEEITALPQLPSPDEVPNDSPRHRKGIRSISSKWASLKGRSGELNEYRKGFFWMR